MVAYEFYRSTYHGGVISSADWIAAEHEAQAHLARYKRIYRVNVASEELENLAVCAMADVLVSYAETNVAGGAVTSASIGSVSESYGGTSSAEDRAMRQEKDLYKAACLYVDIYRGVR